MASEQPMKPNLTELTRLIEELWQVASHNAAPVEYRALKMLLDYCMYLENQIDYLKGKGEWRMGIGDDGE